MNDKAKHIDRLPGNQSDFADLKRLYYQDMDKKIMTYDDTLWRDRISYLCKDLAAIWLKDQPSNKNDTSKEPDGNKESDRRKKKCEE